MKNLLNGKGYRVCAISLLCLILALAGCATKQGVLRVEEKVNQVRIDQKLLKLQLDQVDSLISGGAEADNRLRADIRSSIDDLNNQLTQLQNQITDLNQMLNLVIQRVQAGGGQMQPQTVQISDSVQQMQNQEDSTTAQAPSVDCHNLWDTAFKDIRRAQYDIALSGFSDYLKYCPEGPLADNSQYWIAECYYEMELHEQAIAEYKKLLEKYPTTEKKATAIFKIGRSFEKQDNKDEALKYYLILQNDHPETVQFNQVKDKIAEWQTAKKN
ncbi:MAG: tetratricopeptide repeat protein [candidate division Zixibacteria bacterium]|nr:tetratricopeptide repeat protein [candidate division Zixibacteria bacterium]